jgi:hypothetical protein
MTTVNDLFNVSDAHRAAITAFTLTINPLDSEKGKKGLVTASYMLPGRSPPDLQLESVSYQTLNPKPCTLNPTPYNLVFPAKTVIRMKSFHIW